MTKKPVVYNEAAIEVFEGLDGVRKRPNMYIGETDAHGLQQILKEAYDNGTDELQSIHFGKIKGYGNTIRVKIDEKTNTAYVHDEGRGIPVGKNEKTKISTLTTVLTRLHAGAKMQSADKSAYGAGAVGTNGVGIACTNALSDKLVIYTCRDNVWYRQEFKKGKEITGVVKTKPDSVFGKLKCGTYIEFHPDKQIFGDAQFPVDAIRDWLKTNAYLHPYVKSEFHYKNKVRIYHQPEGAVAFVKEKLEKLKLNPIGKPYLINNNAVTISLQWSDSSSSDLLYSYVNGSPTTSGVHVNTLIKLIEDGIKPFAPKRAKYKASDLITGLVGMINIRLTEPKFSSQTKERLVSAEAKDIITTNIRQSLQAFFASNKPMIKEIVNRAVEFNKLNESFKLSKEAAAKVQTTRAGRTILPEKLTVSNTKIAEERELFLTEGDSAGNIAKFARDPYFQEILKMRGKVLNVIRAQNDKILIIMK